MVLTSQNNRALQLEGQLGFFRGSFVGQQMNVARKETK